MSLQLLVSSCKLFGCHIWLSSLYSVFPPASLRSMLLESVVARPPSPEKNSTGVQQFYPPCHADATAKTSVLGECVGGPLPASARIQPVPPKCIIFGFRAPGLEPKTSASLVENRLAGLAPGHQALQNPYREPCSIRILKSLSEASQQTSTARTPSFLEKLQPPNPSRTP